METELVAAAPSAHQKATCCMEAQYDKMDAMQIYLLRHGIADEHQCPHGGLAMFSLCVLQQFCNLRVAALAAGGFAFREWAATAA